MLRKNSANSKTFLIKQHDLGFSQGNRQAAYLYQIPEDEGKFDNRKDMYMGELIPVMYIPDEDEGEAEAHEGTSEEKEGMTTPNVVISNWGLSNLFCFCTLLVV